MSGLPERAIQKRESVPASHRTQSSAPCFVCRLSRFWFPVTRPSEDHSASSTAPEDRPDWVGYWRVQEWDGETPAAPTYYVATTESWDVVKRDADRNSRVAAHPILEINGQIIVLKDEGEADERAERWEIVVEDGTLRVTARTGPHEGAVGVAERIDRDPRKASPAEADEVEALATE